MKDFVISFSYANYLITNGGTNKAIREHRDMFLKEGMDYVFLFPVFRRFRKKVYWYWGIDLNDRFLGIYSAEAALSYFADRMDRGGKCRAIYIHHMMRIDQKELMWILDRIEAPVYYYLHDFYPICTTVNFFNEKRQYCGYGLDGCLCRPECPFYEESCRNRQVFSEMLMRYEKRLVCIAPSESTAGIYRDTFRLGMGRIRVMGHLKGSGTYRPEYRNGRIRAAFIGAQDDIKGWEDFRKLAGRIHGSDRIDLYYLGAGTEKLEGVVSVPVSVREQGPDAMLQALRKYRIDIAFLLSKWPETYAYTYYEASAAGCYILTYACSGNIAGMVRMNRNGFAAETFEALSDLFDDSGALIESVREYQKRGNVFALKMVPDTAVVKLAAQGTGAAEIKSPVSLLHKRNPGFSLIYLVRNRKKLKTARIRKTKE